MRGNPRLPVREDLRVKVGLQTVDLRVTGKEREEEGRRGKRLNFSKVV